MEQILNAGRIELGLELAPHGRQWSLEEFKARHEVVYGAGNIISEQWGEKNIHADEEAAQREGLAEPVASAPQIFSQIHQVMLSHFGEGWLRGGRMDTKMIKPVYPSDFTVAKVRVTGTSLVDEGPSDFVRVHCDCRVEKLDGTLVMIGTSSAIVSR